MHRQSWSPLQEGRTGGGTNKKENKKKGERGAKNFHFYIKKKSVLTMIVIKYLCMYIYTHIYVYKSIYFLVMSMRKWNVNFVVPRCPGSDERPEQQVGASPPDCVTKKKKKNQSRRRSWPAPVFFLPCAPFFQVQRLSWEMIQLYTEHARPESVKNKVKKRKKG